MYVKTLKTIISLYLVLSMVFSMLITANVHAEETGQAGTSVSQPENLSEIQADDQEVMPQPSEESIDTSTSGDSFVALELDKTTAAVGEIVTVALKVKDIPNFGG